MIDCVDPYQTTRQRGHVIVVVQGDYLALGVSRRIAEEGMLRVCHSVQDTELLLHMKLLRVICNHVRRGGAYSPRMMRIIIGQVMFSRNMDF